MNIGEYTGNLIGENVREVIRRDIWTIIKDKYCLWELQLFQRPTIDFINVTICTRIHWFLNEYYI